MSKIQKISTYLIYALNTLIIIVPMINIVHWILMGTTTIPYFNHLGFYDNNATIHTPEGMLINLNTIHWLPSLKVLGCGADLIGALPTILSLFILKTVFKNYQRGEIFSTNNALSYKKLGWLLVLNALLIKPLNDALITIAVSFHYLWGRPFASVSFGTRNLEDLFLGIIVIVISWVMLEASKLHDEQKLTI